MLGEAVQVQTVIPVSAADQRKLVRTLVVYNVIKGTFQMIHQRCCNGFIIIKRNHICQDRSISGLSYVSAGTCNQPQRIIIEAASDIRVTLLGKRLVLMISTSVLELGRSDIDDSFSCPVRDQMHETEQILAGITEAHSTADSGFIIGSRTGHIEGYHTLILVPDIYHTVNLIVG